MLGTVPDSEIASLAGVTGENVRAFRRRHGIDATWKGARPRKALAKVVPQATTARIQAPTPKSSALMGFLITLKDQGDHVVVAADISSAAQIAVAAGSSEVIAIRTLGPYIG